MTAPVAGRAVAACAIAVAAVAGTPGLAAAETASLPVLRHLVFSVHVGTLSRAETLRRDSIQAIEPSNSRAAVDLRSGDTVTTTLGNHVDGRIVADVVAATLDAGLVVDVSEDAESRTRQTVRVAIFPNGRLDYPADRDLTEEETFVLMMLARRIAPERIEKDATWQVDDAGKAFRWHTSFHALTVAAPDDCTLEVDSSLVSHGVGGPSVESHGTVRYDPSRDVPRSATIETKVRGQTASATTTADLAIALDLTEDSFAKP